MMLKSTTFRQAACLMPPPLPPCVLVCARADPKAASYRFGTASREFLAANFEPAIFSALPFTWSEKGALVGRHLSDAIVFERTHGKSFDLIAQQHNEQVARPVDDIIHIRLQLMALKAKQLRRRAQPGSLHHWVNSAADDAPTSSSAVTAAAAAAGGSTAAAVASGMSEAVGAAAQQAAKPRLPPLPPLPPTQSSPSAGSKVRTLFGLLVGTRKPHSTGAPGVAAGGTRTAAGSNSSATAAAGNTSSCAAADEGNFGGGAGADAVLAVGTGTAAGSSSGRAARTGTAAGGSSGGAAAASTGAAAGGSSSDRAGSTGAAAGPGLGSGPFAGIRAAKDIRELQLLSLGAYDKQGFALNLLNSQFAVDVFMGHSKQQEQLQVAHMQGLASGGHVSLDHVHQLSKRMQGDYLGTLIACGASGVVLGFWHVHSTSMHDVQQSLRDLRARSVDRHKEVSHWQWVEGGRWEGGKGREGGCLLVQHAATIALCRMSPAEQSCAVTMHVYLGHQRPRL